MSNNSLSFDIFISYRREGGETLGRLFFELLKNDYRVFFDHESLSSGRFDKKLLDIIEGCSDVLFILTKGCFDRCSNANDWFMQEVSCALEHNKNIILLMSEDFCMPSSHEAESIHPQLAQLIKYNGYKISMAYIDSITGKLHKDLKAEVSRKSSSLDDISTWRNISSLLSDEKFVSSLPKDIVNSILYNTVNTCLGEYNGPILNSMIEKSFRQEYNIRSKYRYEISLLVYLLQLSSGLIAGKRRASERSRERPRKAPTTFSVACVTGSSKLPPAGETEPPMVTEPMEPSRSLTRPARS